jgi:hypothetical protein
VLELKPETAVPVIELREKLSFLQNLNNPLAWTGHFRGSLTKFNDADGEAVTEAVLDATNNPIVRPVDKQKLKYRPKALVSREAALSVIVFVALLRPDPLARPDQQINFLKP